MLHLVWPLAQSLSSMVVPTRSQNSSWHSLWDLRGTQAPQLRQSNNTLGGPKGPVMRKLCLCHDVIMIANTFDGMELVGQNVIGNLPQTIVFLVSGDKYHWLRRNFFQHLLFYDNLPAGIKKTQIFARCVCFIAYLWFGTDQIYSHIRY